MRALKNPIRSLAVPDQRVARQLHIVLDSELHKGVGSRPVIAFFPGPRMQAHPFHLILGHHVIELSPHKRHVGFHLLFAPPEASPSSHRPIDCGADFEMILVGVFEGGCRSLSTGDTCNRGQEGGMPHS